MSSEFSWKAYQDMFESNGKKFIKTLPAFLGIFYLAVEQVTGKPELNHPHGQECMSWIASLPEQPTPDAIAVQLRCFQNEPTANKYFNAWHKLAVTDCLEKVMDLEEVLAIVL